MRVAILGCGYVGIAAGERLASAGHEVIGVRRSTAGVDAITEAGLTAMQGDVTDPADLSTIPDVDWLVFAASAGRGEDQDARSLYVDGLATTIETFADREDPPARLVYTSSTGVYGDHGGAWVDEETTPEPAGPRGETLLEAEQVALDGADTGIDATVLRFGGLYGPTRYRIDRYLERPVTTGYRNATHRRDAAGSIAHVLEAGVGHNSVVLAVDGHPMDSGAFARWLAMELGVDEPTVRSIEERLQEADLSSVARERIRSNKRCRNDRLRSLGYEVEVPNVKVGYRPAIEAALQRS